MKKLSLVGLLAVVAMLAAAAVGAASAAAALPEFYQSGAPISKTVVFDGSGGTSTLTTVNNRAISCTANSVAGEIISPAEVELHIVFAQCKSSAFTEPICESGATEGTIETKTLRGQLGYINKASEPPEVGVDLRPEPGADFMALHCETVLGTEAIEVTGSIICHLEPVKVEVAILTMRCGQTGGEQEPGAFEGGEEDTLTMRGEGSETFEEKAALEWTSELTFAEPIEVRA